MTKFELLQSDADYPSALLESPDPPKVLRGCGDPSLLQPGLAVIGARRATPYGLRCAKMFAGWAAERGVPIISGAAMGCDQAAHRAALGCGGITVAVLGCGPDVDYPRRARTLLAEIREKGVVLSECSWGAEPRRWAFARRNRIIAGLARAVLIVEAGLPSGTFNTAGHALDAGRDLLVVPGSVFSPDSRGSNRLIREGARPVSDVSDLALELGISGTPGAASSDVVGDRLLAAVLADPMRPDDLARELELDIVEVSRALGRHQRVGRIAKYRDGRYGPA